jgi:hypothetical protein
MEDILQQLYRGKIREIEKSVKDLQETAEYKEMDESYEKLTATFSKEQEALFEEYSSRNNEYMTLEKERTYANGVRLGMCLILSLFDF